MAELPLLNVAGAEEGSEDAARHLFAQFASKLENLDPAELELLRRALLRMSEGAEVRHAFVVGRPKSGPKVSEGWRRDYALWLEFDELHAQQSAAGLKPVRDQLFRTVAKRHSRRYGANVSFDPKTVERAVRRIERALEQHDLAAREEESK